MLLLPQSLSLSQRHNSSCSALHVLFIHLHFSSFWSQTQRHRAFTQGTGTASESYGGQRCPEGARTCSSLGCLRNRRVGTHEFRRDEQWAGSVLEGGSSSSVKSVGGRHNLEPRTIWGLEVRALSPPLSSCASCSTQVLIRVDILSFCQDCQV